MRTIAAAAIAALASGCALLFERPPDSIALPHVTSFSENSPGDAPPQGWQHWTLSKFKKATQYELVNEAGRTVVKASADASASGLLHPVRVDPRTHPLLSWRWKVTRLIDRADNTRKDAEDSPVRVLLRFDGDVERLPLDDRMFFDNIRVLTGQQMPYATLVYIWENRAPKGVVIPNRHTSRVRMIVAESGREKVGAWQEVTRNVLEDFRRAFGEEPGIITAVGIMTDTDNTGDNVHAYYGDIRFRRSAPPRATFASD